MKHLDAFVVGCLIAAAFIVGVYTERHAASKQILAMQADRIAREGKTDREWYRKRPQDAMPF
jgi:hypothetical protein